MRVLFYRSCNLADWWDVGLGFMEISRWSAQVGKRTSEYPELSGVCVSQGAGSET